MKYLKDHLSTDTSFFIIFENILNKIESDRNIVFMNY